MLFTAVVQPVGDDSRFNMEEALTCDGTVVGYHNVSQFPNQRCRFVEFLVVQTTFTPIGPVER